MKVSRNWLQRYFDAPLPTTAEISELLTFHSFEIESVEGDVLDVKVLPNRAADCLSHRGIAKELSAILSRPLKKDPLRQSIAEFPKTKKLSVSADGTYVVRHTGAIVHGVTVGSSPEWLQTLLTSVGQRSINNVVDILNFVTLDIGQPSGAFDIDKMVLNDGIVNVAIRRAKNGEKITVLTGEEYTLTDSMFVFTDATSGSLLDIAGIKGGLASGITESTKDIFISAGNYDGTLIRKASQTLKLFTDASQRFQNRPSPELTAYGMQAILELIAEVTGGELVGVVDIYPHKTEQKTVAVTAEKISRCIGVEYSETVVAQIFERLGFAVTKDGGIFLVTAPFERTDITIPEDLAEEVGRIVGYDSVPATQLPTMSSEPDQRRFRGIERMKDQLVEKGFIEVSTQSFSKKGDIALANPLDDTRPMLRTTLTENLNEALTRAKQYASLVLPSAQKPKLFEVGTVFPKEGEYVALEMTERVPEWGDAAGTSDNLSIAKLEDYGTAYVPRLYNPGAYKIFSVYPFLLRDIALWVPSGTASEDVRALIEETAGDLLVRAELFDTFEKDENTSYAYHLVFLSMERTLSSEEVDGYITAVTNALAQKNWQVR